METNPLSLAVEEGRLTLNREHYHGTAWGPGPMEKEEVS